ncbi:unnamed protein product [Meloidogyne enterolobii]
MCGRVFTYHRGAGLPPVDLGGMIIKGIGKRFCLLKISCSNGKRIGRECWSRKTRFRLMHLTLV